MSARVPTAADRFEPMAVIFSVLGDPIRLCILDGLRAGEINVTSLCAIVGKRQQAVSHHLTILKLRDVVRMQRRGKSNYYGLTDLGRRAVALAGGFAA